MSKKTKNIFILLLVFGIVFTTLVPTLALEDYDLTAEAALLIDENFDAILYGKNVNKKLFPASTTKVMTAILAIEYAEKMNCMDSLVTIDEEVVHLTKGSHIALDYDEEMKYKDLLNGLLIASANDSALALAKYIGGSIDAFVDMMNEKAKELGAVNTHFANPNGLHDDDHYSTAYDLFLIAKYAMGNDLFRKIVSTGEYIIDPTNKKEEQRIIHNTNKFVYAPGILNVNGDKIDTRYEGVQGIKTGYTEEAKNCLITYANRNGKALYTVVLKANGYYVYSDTMKLLNHGFNDFQYVDVIRENEFVDNFKVSNSTTPYISAITEGNLVYPVDMSKGLGTVEKEVLPDEIMAPIKKGDKLGIINYYIDDELIGTGNIVSTMDIESTAETIKNTLMEKWYIYLISFYIILRLIQMTTNFFKKKRRQRRRDDFRSNVL